MGRDVNGDYSLPLPDVESGETIQSSWANTTMDDLEVAMTDSLDRNGRGGMLAPFSFADGAVGSPGATFSNETSSGLYRAGAGDVRMSILGVDVGRWSSGTYSVWNATEMTFQEVAVLGGVGTVPSGTQQGDILEWSAVGETWNVGDPILRVPAGQADNDYLTWDNTQFNWVLTTVPGDHFADGAIHFEVGTIDHTAILEIGTNTHAQIDTHIATADIHTPLTGAIAIEVLTQAAYDLLAPPDANTLYMVTV